MLGDAASRKAAQELRETFEKRTTCTNVNAQAANVTCTADCCRRHSMAPVTARPAWSTGGMILTLNGGQGAVKPDGSVSIYLMGHEIDALLETLVDLRKAQVYFVTAD